MTAPTRQDDITGLLACPNDPPCPHPALVHDTDELNQPQPLCCAQGCDCGRRRQW
jgi:hypothetical protein